MGENRIELAAWEALLNGCRPLDLSPKERAFAAAVSAAIAAAVAELEAQRRESGR